MILNTHYEDILVLTLSDGFYLEDPHASKWKCIFNICEAVILNHLSQYTNDIMIDVVLHQNKTYCNMPIWFQLNYLFALFLFESSNSFALCK